MKLKAKDSFHASGVGTVHAGAEFETHDALGQELVDKGHAEIVGDSDDATEEPAGELPGEEISRVDDDYEQPADAEEKAELPPLNKVEPAPKNKRGRPPAAAPEPEAE